MEAFGRVWLACRDRLAGYKVPKTFEITGRLPRDDVGKIRRSALAAERQVSA